MLPIICAEVYFILFFLKSRAARIDKPTSGYPATRGFISAPGAGFAVVVTVSSVVYSFQISSSHDRSASLVCSSTDSVREPVKLLILTGVAYPQR